MNKKHLDIIYSIIRPVAGQGSSPETRFSFLKHFRILYPFIPNTIQINQRLCNNWHCKEHKKKKEKSMSVTLILMSCTGIGMVLHKILDKALSSHHNWIKSIEGFAKKKKKKKKNWNCKTFITKLLYKNSGSVTFWVGNGTILNLGPVSITMPNMNQSIKGFTKNQTL